MDMRMLIFTLLINYTLPHLLVAFCILERDTYIYSGIFTLINLAYLDDYLQLQKYFWTRINWYTHNGVLEIIVFRGNNEEDGWDVKV
jgi:hypothetical protein